MPHRLLPLALAALLAGPGGAVADFRFVFTSDTHVGARADAGHAAADAALFAEMAALDPRPAFVVNTGDVTEIATPDEFAAWRAVQPALDGVPIRSAPGNHDVRWNPLGKEGFTAGTGRPLYESWDEQGVHFVLLDSTVLLNHVGHVDAQQLQWLKDDLEKVGPDRPVVIGFHHWVGRDAVMVDNERDLIDLVAPYNVVLWLQGHGHSNIDWSINGTPAVMVQGLYQGSYAVVDVTADRLTVSRRVPDAKAGEALMSDAENGAAGAVSRPAVAFEELLSVPLARADRPSWSARLDGGGESIAVVVDPGDLPAGTTVGYRLNNGGYRPAADAGTTPADGSPDAPKAVASPRSSAALAREYAARMRQAAPTEADVPSAPAQIETETVGPATPPAGQAIRFDVDASDAVVGRHDLTVRAELPDGRTYSRVLPVTVGRSDAPAPAWSVNVGGAVQSALVRDAAADGPDGPGSLYVTTMGGDLVALNPLDGSTRWRFHAEGSIFAAPCVAGDTVYVGSADHRVYAIHAATGDQKWASELGGAVFSGPAYADVAGGVVCAASVDQKVYGLDAATGATVWTAPVGGMVQSRIAADGEAFYVGGWDNRLRRLDAATGREDWSVEMGRSAAGAIAFYFAPAIAAPAVADVPLPDGTTARRVFISSNDGVLHAVDAATGEEAWSYDGKKVGYSSPLYRDGRVYTALGDAGDVFCFDAASGEQVWQGSAGTTVYDSSFAYADGKVFLSTVAGVLNAFDAETGDLAWRYRLGTGHTLASPATGDGRVYAAGMSGDVVALPTGAVAKP